MRVSGTRRGAPARSYSFFLQGKLNQLLHGLIRLCARERILLSVWSNDNAPRCSIAACSLRVLYIVFYVRVELAAFETGRECRSIKADLLRDLGESGFYVGLIVWGGGVEPAGC